MFIESRDFDAWMKRIMERFDRLESKIDKPDEEAQKAQTIDGERLYDNRLKSTLHSYFHQINTSLYQ
jgi:hypothetical protein